MSKPDTTAAGPAPEISGAIESPPPSAQPARQQDDDARTRLHRLANALVRTQNRRLLAEFLTLRRATR